jgi:hypothetical protein
LRKIFTVNGLKIVPMAKMTSIYTIKASFIASTYTYRQKAKAVKKPPRRGRRR